MKAASLAGAAGAPTVPGKAAPDNDTSAPPAQAFAAFLTAPNKAARQARSFAPDEPRKNEGPVADEPASLQIPSAAQSVTNAMQALIGGAVAASSPPAQTAKAAQGSARSSTGADSLTRADHGLASVARADAAASRMLHDLVDTLRRPARDARQRDGEISEAGPALRRIEPFVGASSAPGDGEADLLAPATGAVRRALDADAQIVRTEKHFAPEPPSIGAQIAAAAQRVIDDATSDPADAAARTAPAPAQEPPVAQRPALRTMTIELQPESLGALRLNLRIAGAHVRMEIEVATARSIEKVKDAREELRTILEKAGFAADDVAVAAGWRATSDAVAPSGAAERATSDPGAMPQREQSAGGEGAGRRARNHPRRRDELAAERVEPRPRPDFL